MDTQKVTVVDFINLASIELMVSMMDQFPLLKDMLRSSQNPSQDWDFFMTAAGTGLYLMASEEHKGDHQKARQRALELNQNMPRAIDDFTSYMNKAEPTDELLYGFIGSWVLMNIKKDKLTNKELSQLTGRIGAILTKLIADWKNSI